MNERVIKVNVLFRAATSPQQVFLKLVAGLFVHGRERLVHERNLAVDCKGAGEAGTLAHSSRQFMRIAALKPGQPDLGDTAFSNSLSFGPACAVQFQSNSHVAQDVRPWKQREVLEHECTARPRYGPVIDFDVSGSRFQKPSDDFQQCCLSTAGRSQKRRKLYTRNLQIGWVDRDFTGERCLKREPRAHHVNRRRLLDDCRQAVLAIRATRCGKERSPASVAPDRTVPLQHVECLPQRGSVEAKPYGQLVLRWKRVAGFEGTVAGEFMDRSDRAVLDRSFPVRQRTANLDFG